MKKKLFIVLLIILTFTFVACNNTQHVYDPADRVVLSSENQSLRMFAPGLDTNVALADLIAVVEVKDNGRESTYILGEDLEERWQIPVTNTHYTFEVKDIWHGEVEETELEVVLAGGKGYGCTKPYQNDQLIVFMSKRQDGLYILVDDEHSMFAINPPDGTLYSFSNKEDLTCYDSCSPDDLKMAISTSIHEICTEGGRLADFAGLVCEEVMQQAETKNVELQR